MFILMILQLFTMVICDCTVVYSGDCTPVYHGDLRLPKAADTISGSNAFIRNRQDFSSILYHGEICCHPGKQKKFIRTFQALSCLHEIRNPSSADGLARR
jgi:hypothetical protein